MLRLTQEATAGKLHAVYAKCGLDGDAGLSSVQMVAGLEAKLEEFLVASEQLTPEAVVAGQRAREAARRKVRLLLRWRLLFNEQEGRAGSCLLASSACRLGCIIAALAWPAGSNSASLGCSQHYPRLSSAAAPAWHRVE